MWRIAPLLLILASERARADNDLIFVACNEAQQAAITTAVQDARRMARDAVLYMTDKMGKDPKPYEAWFGSASSDQPGACGSTFTTSLAADRVYRVRNSLRDIMLAVTIGSLTFDCSTTIILDPDHPDWFCGRPANIAFVRRSATEFKTIYLCDPFWQLSDSYDSKPGAILHEISHFVDVADTIDDACKPMDCQSKALSDPDGAVRNAYAYQYFIESRPYGGASGCTAAGASRVGPSNLSVPGVGHLWLVALVALLVRRRRLGAPCR